MTRPDLDVIDVVTPSQTHFELAWAALEAGKHVLCEKPVAYDFRETRAAAELAREQGAEDEAGLHLPVQPRRPVREVAHRRGLRRYAVHLQRLRAELAVARSTDPAAPGRPDAEQSVLQTSSLEGYGAPIIDIGHWWVGADFSRVVGTMRNFIPERMVRATGRMMRMNIDDGDIFIGEFANGALGSIQTSFVTVGNYPGIEARIYGEQRRASSAAWSRRTASPRRSGSRRRTRSSSASSRSRSAFTHPAATPRESWRTLFYANLVRGLIDEILTEGGAQRRQFR